MPRSNNILQFRSAGDWSLKLFVVLFYCFLAWMLISVLQLSEGAIWFLFMLGGLYFLGIRQKVINQHYLQKNALLLIILFFLALFLFPTTLIPLIAIAIVYCLLIGRSHRDAPYFVRFHILTALLINFFIILTFLLTAALIDFTSQLGQLVHIQSPWSFSILYYGQLLTKGLIGASAVWLSISALMGRTPYIGGVANNVRHWT